MEAANTYSNYSSDYYESWEWTDSSCVTALRVLAFNRQNTHLCNAQVTKTEDATVAAEEKIGWLEITMQYAP